MIDRQQISVISGRDLSVYFQETEVATREELAFRLIDLAGDLLEGTRQKVQSEGEALMVAGAVSMVRNVANTVGELITDHVRINGTEPAISLAYGGADGPDRESDEEPEIDPSLDRRCFPTKAVVKQHVRDGRRFEDLECGHAFEVPKKHLDAKRRRCGHCYVEQLA
jgi:hypothetical protein